MKLKILFWALLIILAYLMGWLSYGHAKEVSKESDTAKWERIQSNKEKRRLLEAKYEACYNDCRNKCLG